MSKDTFVKASFMFLTIFLDICENPRRNTVINPCYPKHPKIKIEKKKNVINFYFQFSLQYIKKVL